MILQKSITVDAFERKIAIQINKETTVNDIISHILEYNKCNKQTNQNMDNYYFHCNNSPIYRRNEHVFPLYEKGRSFYFGPKIKSRALHSSFQSCEKKSRSKSSAFVNYIRRKSSVGLPSNKEQKDSILSKIAKLQQELEELNLPKQPKITNDIPLRMIKQIGRGACSKVYSCYVNEWMCAVKVISLVGLNIGNFDMFSEIEILENLRPHENIVNYISHTKDKDTIKIFTKLYQSTLDDEIKERKNNHTYFKTKDIIEILIDVSAGIKHLHLNNIIHRDIKAQNIFTQCGLDGNSYVIGDFDSAKQLGRKKRANSIIGTPTFMAPEILNSLESMQSYTIQADIFSFGMLMFHIMTLNIPYHNINSFEVSNNIINGIPPKFPKDLPKNYTTLLEIFKECTALHAENRPSATQLHSKLLDLQLHSE